MLVKVPGKDTASVVTALSRRVRTLPATLHRSLTWDRGMDGPAQAVDGGDGGASVFLRSAKPVATGHKRKHEPLAASVFSERHQPVTVLPRRLEHHRVTVESTPTEDIGIADTGGYTGGGCCNHRLNLPP